MRIDSEARHGSVPQCRFPSVFREKCRRDVYVIGVSPPFLDPYYASSTPLFLHAFPSTNPPIIPTLLAVATSIDGW